MMKVVKNKVGLVSTSAVLLMILFFISSLLIGLVFLDPDFGWHLKLGEIIIRRGVPVVDPFSYTMPDYPFVDYEWFSNVLMFRVHEVLGYGGLAAASSIILLATLGFFMLSRSSYWHVSALLVGSILLTKFGIRPQILSWLFISFFYYVFSSRVRWERWRYYFPLIFVVWINLHGSYPLGYFVMGVYYLYLTLLRKIESVDIIVFFGSLFMLLLNPYGIRNLGEVLMQMSQSSFFRQTVTEWFPFYYSFDLAWWGIFTISIIFLLRDFRKLEFWKLLLYAFFFISGLYSLRHQPFFAIVAGFLLIELFERLEDSLKDNVARDRFGQFYNLLVVVSLVLFVGTTLITLKSKHKVSEDLFYPVGAVDYLKITDDKSRIFTKYGWGGYMIWKRPGERLFVDGRMAGFSWEAPEGQSDHAFREYLAVECGEVQFEDVFERYGVGLVVWEYSQKMEPDGIALTGFLADVEGAMKDVLEVSYCRPEEGDGLMDRMERSGWKVVYQDDVSVVYSKK